MASGYSRLAEFSSKQQIENVECRVCDDVFSLQGEKVPRLLHCGHTVCHQCLTRLPLHDRTILCPFDRQPTEVGDTGVWELKKNFTLIELLEKLQYGLNTPSVHSNHDCLEKEKEFCIVCDESDDHVAVLYCTVCGTHLCHACSEATHATRTLSKHRRVPLSEKPRENPKCHYHPMHLVEFVCMEEDCQNSPLMCYICKDYGRHAKHKHSLLETEAESVRSSMQNAVQHFQHYIEEINNASHDIRNTIQQVEGIVQLQEDGGGLQRSMQRKGTAEEARIMVTQHFHDLREKLKQQEVASITVVDTHIRERLCTLKQQQEDMVVLLSQVSSVCKQCEKIVKQDDAKVLGAKNEVDSLLDSVHKQQHQFADLPSQLQLDPVIPITFTKDNRVHIGPKMEMRVVILGLDDAGKTSILFRLKQQEFIQTISTIGFNVEVVEYKNLKFTIWDVGGQNKLRPLWKHYYLNTQALIFVVDSSQPSRVSESYNELVKLLQEKELKEASLLLLANKQDMIPCLSIEEITEQLNLFKLCCNRSWHIQACDAKSGAGLVDGLEWLSYQMVAASN